MKKEYETPAVINMTVLNDDNFLSPYSETDKPVISEEVASFLDNAASARSPKQKLAVKIFGDCIDDEERVKYGVAMKNYFRHKWDSVIRELRRNAVISALFFLVGVAGLAFMILCDHLQVKAIWVEVIDIFAWVFLWEAVDQFFIERRKLLTEKSRIKNFLDAPVEFSVSISDVKR